MIIQSLKNEFNIKICEKSDTDHVFLWLLLVISKKSRFKYEVPLMDKRSANLPTTTSYHPSFVNNHLRHLYQFSKQNSQTTYLSICPHWIYLELKFKIERTKIPTRRKSQTQSSDENRRKKKYWSFNQSQTKSTSTSNFGSKQFETTASLEE